MSDIPREPPDFRAQFIARITETVMWVADDYDSEEGYQTNEYQWYDEAMERFRIVMGRIHPAFKVIGAPEEETSEHQ